MKIGILGGSFNPVHKGHTNIAKYFVEHNYFDEVWLVPTKINTLKPDRAIPHKEDIIRMLKITLDNLNNSRIKLNPIEMDSPHINYTIELVKELKSKHPEHQFNFIIGSDVLEDLEKWKNINHLREMINFYCYPRSQKLSATQKENIRKFKIHYVNENNLFLVSSNELFDGKNMDWSLVDSDVLKYISAFSIYANDRVKLFVSPKRYQHILNVCEASVKLAKKHNLNEDIARCAAIYHDILREYNVKELEKTYMDESTKKYKGKYYLYHSKLAGKFLKDKFHIDNPTAFKAIASHTMPEKDIDVYGQILFVADKISPERNYPGINELRKLANKNLQVAFKKCLENTLIYLKKNNLILTKDDQEVFEYLINKN